MVTYAKIQTSAVLLVPVAAAGQPAGSLYLDDASGSVSTKDAGGTPAPAGGGSASKQMQAGILSGTIPAGAPVSKRSDGKIVPADADAPDGQQFCGWAIDAFVPDGLGLVQTVGPTIPGAVAGRGFQPGQEVFLGQTIGVLTTNLADLTGNDDSILKLGIADCAAGAASGTAVDLIQVYEVLSRPGA